MCAREFFLFSGFFFWLFCFLYVILCFFLLQNCLPEKYQAAFIEHIRPGYTVKRGDTADHTRASSVALLKRVNGAYVAARTLREIIKTRGADVDMGAVEGI